VVRGDIRSSFGSSTTTAEGVPLAIRLTVRDAASGDAVEGAGMYLWHCDRDGSYSLYSQGVTGENYLRGAQEADANGTVTFTSIFPACYSGRWPHIHFEVYASLSDATSSGPIVKTSQIALPKEGCEAVYATRATSRAWPTSPRSAWPATTSSATTAASTSSPPCRATPPAATPPP
jgi:protocatechuate 3,4-dioxygenase beta subunit